MKTCKKAGLHFFMQTKTMMQSEVSMLFISS